MLEENLIDTVNHKGRANISHSLKESQMIKRWKENTEQGKHLRNKIALKASPAEI